MVIAVGTGTWGIAAVIPKYLSLRLHRSFYFYTMSNRIPFQKPSVRCSPTAGLTDEVVKILEGGVGLIGIGLGGKLARESLLALAVARQDDCQRDEDYERYTHFCY